MDRSIHIQTSLLAFYHFTIDDNIHVDAHYMYIKNECLRLSFSQQVVSLELNRKKRREKEKKRNMIDNDIRQTE